MYFGRSCWRFPSRIHGLRVDRPCRQLHLLHAYAQESDPGTVIANLRIHFANSDPLTVPLRAGEEAGDWWTSEAVVNHATLAWTGASAKRATLGLWKYTWENPRPDDTVTTIDFESPMNSASLMLAGITVE